MLVQGINAGSGVVNVKLVSRAWQGVSPDSVRLIVKENLMLKPYLPTYIIPLGYVYYTLERRKQGRVEGEGEGREESIVGRVSFLFVVKTHSHTYSK